jgi:hypothetical protein
MARPKIIQAPSEDPREKAIALLLAIQEHDPNMTVEDQVFLGCAVRSCRYSLRTDKDKEAQAAIGADKAVA